MKIWIVDSEFELAIGIVQRPNSNSLNFVLKTFYILRTVWESFFVVKSKEKGEREKMVFYEIEELTAVWIDQL